MNQLTKYNNARNFFFDFHPVGYPNVLVRPSAGRNYGKRGLYMIISHSGWLVEVWEYINVSGSEGEVRIQYGELQATMLNDGNVKRPNAGMRLDVYFSSRQTSPESRNWCSKGSILRRKFQVIAILGKSRYNKNRCLSNVDDCSDYSPLFLTLPYTVISIEDHVNRVSSTNDLLQNDSDSRTTNAISEKLVPERWD